jgi:hypothetical protein
MEAVKRTFTAEHKEKLRRANTGKKYPNRRPMSEEQKAKLRDTVRLKWQKRLEEAKGSETKTAVSVAGYGLRSLREYTPSPVDLCKCGNTFLIRLGCLRCRNTA